MLDRAAQVAQSKEASIYNGCVFSLQEIEIGIGLLAAETKTIRKNFDDKRPVGVKLSAEHAARIANQISILSAVLARTFKSHSNRHSNGAS
jgi:hypothetical protein